MRAAWHCASMMIEWFKCVGRGLRGRETARGRRGARNAKWIKCLTVEASRDTFRGGCGIHSFVDIDSLIQKIDYVTVEDELINVRDQTILDDGAVLFPVVSVFFLARFAIATVSMYQ